MLRTVIFLLLVGLSTPSVWAQVFTANGSAIELPADVADVSFDLAQVHIHTAHTVHRVLAEVAVQTTQHQRGLMYRTSMPEESGMLFLFFQDRSDGFWMYRTHVPLSIAYVDSQGVIVALRDMMPCYEGPASVCRSQAMDYRPQAAYRFTLEVNQGYFFARGIGVGDRVTWQWWGQ